MHVPPPPCAQLQGDNPSAVLERIPQLQFSSLPHPLLESFVEEFLMRVKVCLFIDDSSAR
jgi:hypothetical protein